MSPEQERGYDYSEDLYSPGYFKIKLKKGDKLIFSAGTSEISPGKLNRIFDRVLKNRNPLTDFNACLENAAEQFIVTADDRARRKRVIRFSWGGVVVAMILTIISIHLFVRPLDVLWSVVMRRLGV